MITARSLRSDLLLDGTSIWMGRQNDAMLEWEELIKKYGYDSVRSACRARGGRAYVDDVAADLAEEATHDPQWMTRLARADGGSDLGMDIWTCAEYSERHGLTTGPWERWTAAAACMPPEDVIRVARDCGYVPGTKAGRRALYDASDQIAKKMSDYSNKSQATTDPGEAPW